VRKARRGRKVGVGFHTDAQPHRKKNAGEITWIVGGSGSCPTSAAMPVDRL
jgi:hypothetical protein